jgi:hypothetical protein
MSDQFSQKQVYDSLEEALTGLHESRSGQSTAARRRTNTQQGVLIGRPAQS